MGSGADWIRNETDKRLKAYLATQPSATNTNSLGDVEFITFTNPIKTRGVTSKGITVDTIPQGPVKNSGWGVRYGTSYIVREENIGTLTTGNTPNLKGYYIFFNTLDSKYYVAKPEDAATPPSYYELDVYTISGGTPFDTIQLVGFSPNGKNIFCSIAQGTTTKYGWAVNFSLGEDVDHKKIVKWESLSQKSILLDFPNFPLAPIPAPPGPPIWSPLPPGGTIISSFSNFNSSSASITNFILYDTDTGPKADIIGTYASEGIAAAEYQLTTGGPIIKTYFPQNSITNRYLFECIDGGTPTSVQTYQIQSFNIPPLVPNPYTTTTSETGVIWNFLGLTPGLVFNGVNGCAFKYQLADKSYVSASYKRRQVIGAPGLWIPQTGSYLSFTGSQFDMNISLYFPFCTSNALTFVDPQRTEHIPQNRPTQWYDAGVKMNVKAVAPESFISMDQNVPIVPPAGQQVALQKWVWDSDHSIPVAAGKSITGPIWDTSTYNIIDYTIRG